MQTAERNRLNSGSGYRTMAVPDGTALRVPALEPMPQLRPGRPAAPARRASSREQTQWILTILMLAFAALVLGTLYISGYAQITREGHRHNQLVKMAGYERSLAQQRRQDIALMNGPRLVEHRARLLGMVRGDERPTITVGETSAVPTGR